MSIDIWKRLRSIDYIGNDKINIIGNNKERDLSIRQDYDSM